MMTGETPMTMDPPEWQTLFFLFVNLCCWVISNSWWWVLVSAPVVAMKQDGYNTLNMLDILLIHTDGTFQNIPTKHSTSKYYTITQNISKHTYIYTIHPYIHTYIHTYIHEFIHTYIHTYIGYLDKNIQQLTTIMIYGIWMLYHHQ